MIGVQHNHGAQAQKERRIRLNTDHFQLEFE